MKASLVKPFKEILSAVKNMQEFDPVYGSMLFSALVYFSNDFIYKIVDELKCTDLAIVETDGLKAIVVSLRGRQFVSFRGTEFSMWSNTKRVINFIPKMTKKGSKAHRGFVMAFADLEKYITPLLSLERSVILTGHSLGGALALLGAEYYSRSTAITFAAPNVFFNENMDFKIDHVGYRIKGDIVPQVPPTTFFLKWSRAKFEWMFTARKKFINPIKYHGLGLHITTIMDKLYGTHQIKA